MEDAVFRGLQTALAGLFVLFCVWLLSVLCRSAKAGNKAVRATLSQNDFLKHMAQIAELHESGIYQEAEFIKRKDELINALIKSAVDRTNEKFLIHLSRFQKNSVLTNDDIKRIRSS